MPAANDTAALKAELLGSRRTRTLAAAEETTPAEAELAGEPVKNARWLETNTIGPDPGQPREQFDEDEEAFQELVGSVRDFGILQPLTATWEADQEKYMLVTGERRWRAAQVVGLPQVPVIVLPPMSEDERRARQVEENSRRANLRPGETLATLLGLLERRGRGWLRTHGWGDESLLARWAGVAENRVIPFIDEEGKIVEGQTLDTWEYAKEHKITAAYRKVVAYRRLRREEEGRAPMGPPRHAGPPPAPVLPTPAAEMPAPASWEGGTSPGGTDGVAPARGARGEGGAETAETEDRPVRPPTRAGAAPGRAEAAPERASAPTSRSAAGTPSSASQQPPAPGAELGVISVDGTLYTVPTARDLATQIYDVTELDHLRQLVGHPEFGRWRGHGTKEEQAALTVDYRGVAQFLRETAQLIEDAVGPAADE